MLFTLLVSLFISLALNALFLLIAYKLKTDKFTDITYALTFIIITVFAFVRSNHKATFYTGSLLVIIWSIRLGSFLLYRVVKKGKDKRFDGMRENLYRFAKFWIGQALVSWMLMIPVILSSSENKSFRYFSIIGILIWTVGLIVESTADYQKYEFRRTEENNNKWIDSGLWKFSRHPNYFGEILVWIGIYIYVFPVLTLSYKLVGLISPLLIFIILRYGSGIPILEKSADQKWGNNTSYNSYKKKTNLLIPFPR